MLYSLGLGISCLIASPVRYEKTEAKQRGGFNPTMLINKADARPHSIDDGALIEITVESEPGKRKFNKELTTQNEFIQKEPVKSQAAEEIPYLERPAYKEPLKRNYTKKNDEKKVLNEKAITKITQILTDIFPLSDHHEDFDRDDLKSLIQGSTSASELVGKLYFFDEGMKNFLLSEFSDLGSIFSNPFSWVVEHTHQCQCLEALKNPAPGHSPPSSLMTQSRKISRRSLAKPMIYLYPDLSQELTLSIDFNGQVTSIYPEYNFHNQWRVWAEPDGTLTDAEKGKTYYGLYWEGVTNQPFVIVYGFVVAGADTAEFLEEKLKLLGLNDRETNEMIVYWLPRMQVNAFNLIHFQTDQYAQEVPLNIEPKPDTQIRIMMLFQPLDEFIEIREQILPENPVERKGFTLVEWGGSEIKATGHRIIE